MKNELITSHIYTPYPKTCSLCGCDFEAHEEWTYCPAHRTAGNIPCWKCREAVQKLPKKGKKLSPRTSSDKLLKDTKAPKDRKSPPSPSSSGTARARRRNKPLSPHQAPIKDTKRKK